jgi:hypothetical protein
MRNFTLVAIFAITVLCGKGQAMAFSAKSTHPYLTHIAYNIYNECAVELLQDADEKNPPKENTGDLTEIIKANKNEDGLTLTRAMNWHFYNPDLPENRKAFLHYRTFDRTFQGIVDDLKEESLTKKEGYEILGRVLHFIEDVTVPAHVVPVYHSFILPIISGKLQSVIKDSIDSYEVCEYCRDSEENGKCQECKASGLSLKKFLDNLESNNKRKLVSTPLSQELIKKVKRTYPHHQRADKTLCKNLQYLLSEDSKTFYSNGRPNPDQLNKILSETARETLAMVNEPICFDDGSPGPNWNYFWNKPDEKKKGDQEFFGKYFFGEYLDDDENSFQHDGPISLTWKADSGTKTCPMRKDGEFNKYDEFVERTYMRAIIADIRVLYFFAELYEK